MKKKTVICSAIIFAFLLLLSSCGQQAEKEKKPVEVKRAQVLMGTEVSIRLLAEDAAQGQKAAAAAFARIKEIEKLMSNFIEESEVCRLNDVAGVFPLEVSRETYRVLARSREISRTTEGAFDITVGPFLKLWKKGAREGQAPSPEALEEAKGLVGFARVKLFAEEQEVLLERRGMEIDLGGIAKGDAVDEAVRALREHGVENALVDAGGDVYCLGRNREGIPWRVGIKDPLGSKEYLGVLSLENKAVATSGDYERFYEIGGKIYSHIIDPRTGRPVSVAVSVTVIA